MVLVTKRGIYKDKECLELIVHCKDCGKPLLALIPRAEPDLFFKEHRCSNCQRGKR